MTVRFLSSTDTDAPVLTGQAGSLVNLLDAALANGYGSMSPLGWTIAHSGTNKRAYRNTGTNSYLRVQDDQASYGRAYVQGYKSMTGIDTGSDGFVYSPTSGTYGVWGKSATIDSTPRAWRIVGDESAFHIAMQHGENGSDFALYFFGDILSYDEADPDRCLIICRQYSTYGVSNLNYAYDKAAYIEPYAGVVATDSGKWMPKNYGSTGPAGVSISSANPMMTSNLGASFYAGSVSMLPYPYMGTNLVVAPVLVHQGTSSPRIVRGRIPGLWVPAHSRPLANLDTYSGKGALYGKSFLALNVFSQGQLHIETTDTWS